MWSELDIDKWFRYSVSVVLVSECWNRPAFTVWFDIAIQYFDCWKWFGGVLDQPEQRDPSNRYLWEPIENSAKE